MVIPVVFHVLSADDSFSECRHGTSLYQLVKAFLEQAGYMVKGRSADATSWAYVTMIHPSLWFAN